MDEQTVYIGIDTTSGKRPATCAVLDRQLQIVLLEDYPMAEIADVVNGYPLAVCGIDAPAQANKGLLSDPAYRPRVGLVPKQKNYSNYRVCEYEVRKRGIHIYNTPEDEGRLKKWMTAGWELYEQLRALGYTDYPETGERVLFETYPHAGYTALVNTRPYDKTSMEGRMQRQLVLYEYGVDVPDAIKVMMEWTRHRFLTGQIDVASLYNHDALDALLAAYTAYLLDRESHAAITLGDTTDGVMVLPVASLNDAY